MEFIIRILPAKKYTYLTYYFNPGKGLNILNAVREKLGKPNFDPEKIYIETNCYDRISEDDWIVPNDLRLSTGELAVESIPQFTSDNITTIHCPPNFFDLYRRLVIYRKYTRSFLFFKELCKVDVKYEIDKNQFILDWIAAGCPSYFDCNKEEIEAEEKREQERIQADIAEREALKESLKKKADIDVKELVKNGSYADQLADTLDELRSITRTTDVTLEKLTTVTNRLKNEILYLSSLVKKEQ